MAWGASPADGCVVVVVNYGTPPPSFLVRFGVLLAVNDQAINAPDALPMANGAEQRLAQHLMSLLRI